MTNLSPVAQAVLEAHDIGFSTPAICLAEALRALADQVVPPCGATSESGTKQLLIRHQILAIANELDNQ
jgi:hypothetical protein